MGSGAQEGMFVQAEGSTGVRMTLQLTSVQPYQIDVFGKRIQRMAKQRLVSSFNTDIIHFQSTISDHDGVNSKLSF